MWLLIVCFFSVILATTLVAILPSTSSSASTHNHTSKHKDDADGIWSIIRSKRMNIRRKFQHVSSGLVILFLYLCVVTPIQAASLLLVSSVILYLLHRLRLVSPSFQRMVVATFGTLLRSHELHSLPGAFWCVLGCGICIALFGVAWPDPVTSVTGNEASGVKIDHLVLDIPAMCILIMSVGDPIASFVGIIIGKSDRWRVRGKSILAAGCMVIVCAIANRVMLGWLQCRDSSILSCSTESSPLDGEIWFWSLLASLFGGIFELFDFEGLDDNFRVPIGTGIIVYIARRAAVQ